MGLPRVRVHERADAFWVVIGRSDLAEGRGDGDRSIRGGDGERRARLIRRHVDRQGSSDAIAQRVE